jgi:5'-nucleotidase/UDP-sugar diphosphatase
MCKFFPEFFLCFVIHFLCIHAFRFSILSTSDLHSSFDPYYPRMAHFVQNYTATTTNPYLILDAGDWYSGTLFKLISISYMLPKESPELEFFKYLKFDATTLGNHEFDGKERGLAYQIEKANHIGGFDLPILTSNIQFQGEDCELKKFAKSTSGVYFADHIVKTLRNSNGEEIKVGLIGIFSPNTALFSTNNRECVHFAGFNDTNSVELWKDYVDSVYQLATKIRSEYDLDLVVALGHSGSPEDSKLLKDLNNLSPTPVIDIHISSHTHEIYGLYQHGAYLFQNDNNGKELGVLELEYLGKTSNPRIKLSHSVLAVNLEQYDKVDPVYQSVVARYKKLIDDVFLSELPYSYDTEVLQLKRTPFTNDLEFGTFLVSSILKQLNIESQKPTSIVSTKMDPVDIYFNSIACVRALPEFYQPNKTIYFHEIFRMLGIGHLDININQNNVPGDPIVHFYVHKSMINTLITATRMYSLLDSAGWFVFSDTLEFDWSWWGIPFVNMATNIKIHGKEYHDWPEYVHLAAPLIIAEFVPKSKQITFGWVDLKILGKRGNILKNGIDDEYTYFKEWLLLSNNWRSLKIIE